MATAVTTKSCMCGFDVTAEGGDETFPDAFLAHVRSAHPDWAFPDEMVRTVGGALLRLTGGTERLDAIGTVAVHAVMPDRLDDWLGFMDHDAFVDKPWVAACYCLEQHGTMAPLGVDAWRANRQAMVDRFRDGKAYGYLAYVDGRPAGWVNAAMRRDQVYGSIAAAEDDDTTITVSCFNIAPPYRGHGLQSVLLDRVLDDAPGRGATSIEAYPANDPIGEESPVFRGSREVFVSRGFEVVKEGEHSSIVRRRV